MSPVDPSLPPRRRIDLIDVADDAGMVVRAVDLNPMQWLQQDHRATTIEKLLAQYLRHRPRESGPRWRWRKMTGQRCRRTMPSPILTPEEQANVAQGGWFASLSSELREAILARAHVRRLQDGTMLAARGAPADEWCGVALGAVRISTVSLAGRQVTLTYCEPGTWFGDIALFDGLPRTHDGHAHGPTTLLAVRRADFRALLAQRTELYEALLRLNCRRLRLMFDVIEDLNTLPLAARLAKQVLLLARSYGVPQGAEIRIGLALAQEDLAQLLGASRQRVNQELKGFEREGALRIEPTRLVVLSKDKLLAIAAGG